MARKFIRTSSQYLTYGVVPQMNSLTKISVAAWAMSTAFSAYDIVTENRNDTVAGWSLQANDTNLAPIFLIGDGTNYKYGQSPTNPGVNNWFHVVGVYDGSQSTDATKCVMYQNGVAQTLSFVGPALPTTVGISTNPLTIAYVGADSYWNGGIARVAVWNTALSAKDALLLYWNTMPNQIRPNNLIFWSELDNRMLGGSDQDLSIYRRQGRPVNGPMFGTAPPLMIPYVAPMPVDKLFNQRGASLYSRGRSLVVGQSVNRAGTF